MQDLISRQAAIEALDEIESEVADGYGYQYEKWRKYFCGLPSAQPDRSLWFRIGEVCVGESKGDISAEMAVEKIRALLRAERREE